MAGSVKPTAGGYQVDVTILNKSPATAAAVQVRGDLVKDGETVESSEMTFDYVPGRSQQKGGLMFRRDPATAEIQLQVMGYTEP